jgi:poly[(R)-3-hydroxyalkanoate] polymerase subunit PhaE
MSDTDYTKFLSDLWMKTGSTLTAAQEQMFKDMAQRMGSGFMFPMQAFAGGTANMGEAGENLRKFVESSLKMSEALAPAAGKTAATDGVTAELLQKIFDPREWLSVTGYVDENVRRVTEGPKLADMGNIEKKFLVLINAWSAVRVASAQHSFNVLQAWSKAANEFATKLNQAIVQRGSLGSRADTVNMWVEIANQHLLEAQRSAPFLETQRKLLQASSDLRIAQQDLGDFYSELLGMPTRAEIDDLSRSVTELKREIRAERRRRREKTKTK